MKWGITTLVSSIAPHTCDLKGCVRHLAILLYAIISDVGISLPTVIIVVAGAIGISIALWVVSIYRQRRVVKEAREWLVAEGTIESGTLEAPEETNKVLLPTFAFSYQVAGDYYAGRFVLMPGKLFPSKELVQSIIDRMIGRKLLLRYDPHHPEIWFIPDEFIDGCKVEQKIGSHAMHRYYPRD